jgi:hypothetical protein
MYWTRNPNRIFYFDSTALAGNLFFKNNLILIFMPLDSLERLDKETLIDLLNLLHQQTKRRRALCTNIGIDPSQLDFVEDTSEKDFCILLIDFLNRTNNQTALCHLCCKELSPKFPNNNKLKEIMEKLECVPSNPIVDPFYPLTKKRKFPVYIATLGIGLTVLIPVGFVVSNNNSSCASSNHKSSQDSVSAKVKIVNLFDGDCVKNYQQIIKGKVTVTVKEAEKLWIVVKPEPDSVYYVQAPADITNGEFETKIYLGEQDTQLGTKFTIRAFVEPSDQLQEGKKLSNWPEAKWSSDLVTVTRNK